MDLVRVELPDGTSREVPRGSSPLDVARGIGEGLARQSVAARLNGQLVDLSAPIAHGSRLEIVTLASRDGL